MQFPTTSWLLHHLSFFFFFFKLLCLTLKTLAQMASFSVGMHFSPTHHFKKRSLLSSSLPSALLQAQPSFPCYGSSLCRTRGTRLLGNGVLARAEEKARGSTSSSSSSFQEQQGQPNSEKQLEVYSFSSLRTKFPFFRVPIWWFC